MSAGNGDPCWPWETFLRRYISITLFNKRLAGLILEWWIIFHNTLLGLLVCFVLVAMLLNLSFRAGQLRRITA